MLRTLKIWWLRRQITRLEQAEDEAKASIQHLQYKILPHYRAKLNEVLYGTSQIH